MAAGSRAEIAAAAGVGVWIGTITYRGRMDLLEPAVKSYDWGSRRIIADLQGRPVPSAGPEAELWMGAHPAGPSLVRAGRGVRGLDEIVAADPPVVLGADVAARFDGRLPFLLKVLAADKALSIQVHPDRETARAAFAAQRASGGEPGNYSDDWPKPEVLCALTPFEALAGLREPREAAGLLRDLQIPELEPIVRRLDAGDDEGLVDALRMLLGRPREQQDELLESVVAACAARVWDDGDHARAYAAVVQIAVDHPGDLGAVASLLLNHTVLQPGEAIFLAAGGLHAYLRGAGIEIVANSDNVLRAGLTSKRIDVDELCRIVDPTVGVPVLRPRPDHQGVTSYPVSVPEFSLYRLQREGGTIELPGSGPRVVLVTAGAARLECATGSLCVERGGSAFIGAADGPVSCTGAVSLFVAGPGGVEPVG